VDISPCCPTNSAWVFCATGRPRVLFGLATAATASTTDSRGGCCLASRESMVPIIVGDIHCPLHDYLVLEGQQTRKQASDPF